MFYGNKDRQIKCQTMMRVQQDQRSGEINKFNQIKKLHKSFIEVYTLSNYFYQCGIIYMQ